MPDSPDTPGSYVVEHAMSQLACDPRVGVLDLEVTVAGTTVTVSGTVETAERRDAVTTVLAELLPDHRLDNRVVIEEPVECRPTAEELP